MVFRFDFYCYQDNSSYILTKDNIIIYKGVYIINRYKYKNIYIIFTKIPDALSFFGLWSPLTRSKQFNWLPHIKNTN